MGSKGSKEAPPPVHGSLCLCHYCHHLHPRNLSIALQITKTKTCRCQRADRNAGLPPSRLLSIVPVFRTSLRESYTVPRVTTLRSTAQQSTTRFHHQHPLKHKNGYSNGVHHQADDLYRERHRLFVIIIVSNVLQFLSLSQSYHLAIFFQAEEE